MTKVMKKQICCWNHRNRLNTAIKEYQLNPKLTNCSLIKRQHVYKATVCLCQSIIYKCCKVRSNLLQWVALFRVQGNLEVTLDSCPGTGQRDHSKMPCMHALMLGLWLNNSLHHWRRSNVRNHVVTNMHTSKPASQKPRRISGASQCMTQHW